MLGNMIDFLLVNKINMINNMIINNNDMMVNDGGSIISLFIKSMGIINIFNFLLLINNIKNNNIIMGVIINNMVGIIMIIIN